MSFAITVFPSAAPRCRNTTCSTRPSRYSCCKDFTKKKNLQSILQIDV